jgi:membrane protein DedA with SNARE-associated domain
MPRQYSSKTARIYFSVPCGVIWYYVWVFVAALLVDVVPFFGPPAWTVMVFFQMRYNLDILAVIVIGVVGSTVGRYILSKYIPFLSSKILKTQKGDDIAFIGKKLETNGWQIQLFVLLYTLLPLPSTPLFTASGMAKIKAIRILPAFFVGKFTSDMLMVVSGDYVARNTINMAEGLLSWQSITGTILGIIIISVFLFIDWRVLLQQKKFRLNFRIWK